MTCGLVVTDWAGLPVRLSHANWQEHVARRPYMAAYHDDLVTAVNDPDFVMEDPKSGAALCYRMGLGRGKFINCYLRVVVLYAGGGTQGVIATAFMAHAPHPRGSNIWTRPTPL